MVEFDEDDSRTASSFLHLESLEEIKSQEDVKGFLNWVDGVFTGNSIFSTKILNS